MIVVSYRFLGSFWPCVLIAAWMSACSDDASSPGAGEAGGPCYPNGSCNDGLACTGGICADPGAAAGVVGGPCYPNDSCNAGLVCSGAVCAVARVDDTGVDTGGSGDTTDTGIDTGGSGDTGPAPDTNTPPVEETIGPAGGVIEFGDFRLTIPAGALAADTAIAISFAADQSPAGYDLYTGVYRFAPAGTTFAIPATVSARFDGDAGRATLFWTAAGGSNVERRGGLIGSDGRLEGTITHFSEGFVADGVSYTDTSDRSCVVTRLIEGRDASSAGVSGGLALFFTVDDCAGRAVTGLTASDFVILEDGSPLSSGAEASVLPSDGRGIFVSLVLDLSSSVEPVVPELLAGARAFIDSLEAARLPVQLQISAFGGDATATVRKRYSLDIPAARLAIDELARWRPADAGTTNLHGAVVQAMSESAAAQAAFLSRNQGGAFASGYVVVFTDGTDTAARVTLSQAQAAVSRSADEFYMVGLEGLDYNDAALTAIAPANHLFRAATEAQLTREFAALANRIAGQAEGTYLLGYCSPKRAGSHEVSIQVAGAENRRTASYPFDATGFDGTCRASAFATVCEGNECGGLGCGACDDRTTGCVTAGSSFVCEDLCTLLNECSGGPIYTDLGLPLVCAETLDRTSCAGTCVSILSDSWNCGGCNLMCPEGASCTDGLCVCPTGSHEEDGLCTSDTRSCPIPNGSGSQSYVSWSWESCGVVSCDSTFHVESGACISDTRACSAANATAATESWTGSVYGVCTASACTTDYHVESGACINDARACSSLPANATAGTETWTGAAYGACSATACDASYHVDAGACASDTRSCVITNGTGSQTYASGSWDTCGVVSCDSAYHVESGACVSDTRSCIVANGIGSQSYASGSWGSCGLVSCNSTFHIESGTCVSDTRACTSLVVNSTAGTQVWDGSTYGICSATACASGYWLNTGACILQSTLSTACTLNAECASGFCATGPTGTANDRCAPASMNYIPAGSFTMGSPSSELGRYSGGESQHPVTLSRPFFLGQTEVTQGQWKALSGGINPSCFQSTTGIECTSSNANDDGPVEQLNWYAAIGFANARSAAEGLTSCYVSWGCNDPVNGWKDGQSFRCAGAIFEGLTCTGYRLPTESEWEYAARAGSTLATYVGNLSGTVTNCTTAQANLDGIAWWCGNAGGRTHGVGGKAANNFGLYDMLGNLNEWTGDWYAAFFVDTVTDPTGPASITSGIVAKLVRGGSYNEVARDARAAYRLTNAAPVTMGFRLARTAPGLCDLNFHWEADACVSDTRACSPLPANTTAGTQIWTGSAYGSCTATTCASGYVVNAGACIFNNLGSACTNNAECASGNCATGPTGTANDRCAPASMNYIPSGTFTMGSPSGEVGRGTDETQHSVTISRSFFMAQTEVTQDQWKALSGGVNPSCFQSVTGTTCTNSNANDSGPVEQMDWYGAVAFANAKSAAEGLTSCYTLTGCTDAANGWKDGIHSGCTGATFSGLTCTGYRLPTESEWEYAARGGTTTATYLGNLSGGVDDCTTAQASLDGIAWWCSNSGSRTNAVGSKAANSFGLSDMLGNALEWTGDWYAASYPGTATDPLGSAAGSSQVSRGGSWGSFARIARAAFRGGGAPDSRDNFLGFRLSRTVTRDCTTLPLNATAGVEAGNAAGWDACEATACATSYHVESGACLSDTRSCSLSNATTATQTWSSATSAYGSCTASACASGYWVNAGACVLQSTLGTACTLDAACASGFCATGPAGTANDRCAPTGMNYIPAGTFTMGSASTEVGRYPEETQHTVTLSRAFFMGQTEVTQDEWKALSGWTNPSYFQNTWCTYTVCASNENVNDGGPAEQMDWYAAVAFANARSAAEGLTSCYTLTGCTAASGWKDGIHSGCTGATFSGLTCTGYRLPTESEWEYAARGGTTTATYLGDLSGVVDDCSVAQANLDGIAWRCGNAGNRAHYVSSKPANSFGLYDMLGNVFEWTGDWYGAYPATVTNPTGPTTGSNRVARGGSWGSDARSARAATRSSDTPVTRFGTLGFRLARTAP